MNVADSAKRAAAEAAAEYAADGMRIGLGTGSTVAHLLPALAARGLRDLRCVATSVATERAAQALGLAVEPFDRLARLDLAIDGADQVTPPTSRWSRAAAARMCARRSSPQRPSASVVIADESKLVDSLRAPLPLELLAFGLAATLDEIVGPVTVRAGAPRSPDGGVIWDLDAPPSPELATALDAIPGVTGHGWFAPELVAEVLVGASDGSVRTLRR